MNLSVSIHRRLLAAILALSIVLPSYAAEYFEIAEATTLSAHSERKKNKKYRAFIAAKIDGVRLIDNLAMN